MPPLDSLLPESPLLLEPETIFEMEPMSPPLELELFSELDPGSVTSRATSCTFCFTR